MCHYQDCWRKRVAELQQLTYRAMGGNINVNTRSPRSKLWTSLTFLHSSTHNGCLAHCFVFRIQPLPYERHRTREAVCVLKKPNLSVKKYCNCIDGCLTFKPEVDEHLIFKLKTALAWVFVSQQRSFSSPTNAVSRGVLEQDSHPWIYVWLNIGPVQRDLHFYACDVQAFVLWGAGHLGWGGEIQEFILQLYSYIHYGKEHQHRCEWWLLCCFISNDAWQMSVLLHWAAGPRLSQKMLRTYAAQFVCCQQKSRATNHATSAHHRLLQGDPETFDLHKHGGQSTQREILLKG